MKFDLLKVDTDICPKRGTVIYRDICSMCCHSNGDKLESVHRYIKCGWLFDEVEE